ncbi:MAG: hypothetical protein AB8B64_25035 [Granulosicoccus sp.]
MPAVLIIVSLLSISQITEASTSGFYVADDEPRLFIQSQLGIASESDFGPALLFHYESAFEPTRVFAISIGKQVGRNFFRWPASIVVYGSLQHFGERGTQPDFFGATIHVKAYRNFNLGTRRTPIRLGLGEGLSYVEQIPSVEVMDFLPQRSSRLVNYLEWTLQTSVGHFLGRPEGGFSANIRDVYVGYSIFHRSTIFGLLASEGGGINYMGISIELVLN